MLYTFPIFNKAFKNVRPLLIGFIQEVKYRRVPETFFITKKPHATGRAAIKFTYDRGPGTKVCVEYITFYDIKQAHEWYKTTYDTIFAEKKNNLPPPPPNKKKGLHLV